MERAVNLTFFQFLQTSLIAIILFGFVAALITIRVTSARARSAMIVLAVSSLITLIHLLGTLPHINIKFYYLFGFIVSIVIAVSDYLHHVVILDVGVQGESKFVATALQERHRKWTSILGYAVTLLTIIIGTISFNTIFYIRIIFGDSFLIAPTLGIAAVSMFVILVFAIGVIGNIRKILVEIEGAIAALTDKTVGADVPKN
jgi:hypothetical protein